MSRIQARTSKKLALAGACAAAVAAALVPNSTPAQAMSAAPPPAHADFDYQIGGAYTPPAGVEVVSRDHTAAPVPGLYNICYVNAFQAQPDAEDDWASDLLLRDANGDVVYDTKWGEAFLDIRTDAKRKRIAEQVGTWIDNCADKGFDAIEPDNYDSYTRSGKLLDSADAQAFIKLLAARAHADGLAIGQKNTVELAPERQENGLDFAVAEECGQYDECGDYTAEFGDHVIVIEYNDEGMAKACAEWGDTLSVVRRDEDVSPRGSSGYVRETC
ncbi:endo alpha-1,4 polygalactosaminidase [Streptomyces lancefieldiae]|uniref:Endo alpha-1,4 polygalactosaminidase n=1 Tax=Streptomyces lancefieldiae TaxID=3075520 RepID=A0ABU3ALU5_9ACTN|nr:endo alpha-1,4 polygalactosaminidase [Streptomyces sp. DSM 40712]MDT0611166.1 endo alpha-1,4 polygalactosaminidase [Streptomyces sp. DSM 40712]